jgi:acetyl-CoA C-acetyltransferase
MPDDNNAKGVYVQMLVQQNIDSHAKDQDNYAIQSYERSAAAWEAGT